MKLDTSGVDMVSDHAYQRRQVKRVEIIEKRKARDRRFFKVEFTLMTVAAILLLNDEISMKQMLISGAFAVAGIVTDIIRRYV